MDIPRKQAEKLCSESEFDLVKSSYETGPRAARTARLKQKIKLVRKLRDKYRDVSRRKRREARRYGLSAGEPVLVDTEEARPLSRLQRLLQEKLRPAKDLDEPVARRRPEKPTRIQEDLAADRAARKAEIFQQTLRRMEEEAGRRHD